MADPVRPWCRALLWVRVRGHILPLLPLRSVGYLCSIFLIGFAGCVLIELGLQVLERWGRINTTTWVTEDLRIISLGYRKNAATVACPIWRSKGFPVSEDSGGVKRILVVGDSFVWGDGYVNMNDIWWRQLQRELNHRGYWGVQVIGAGLRGASTHDELRWLRDGDILKRYHPDAVVIGYVTDDPEERASPGGPVLVERPRPQPQTAVAVHSVLKKLLLDCFPRLHQQLRQQLERMRARHQADEQESNIYAWELKLLTGRNMELYRGTVRELGEFKKSLPYPLFAFTTPVHPSREFYTPRYAPVTPLFEQAGVPFYNCIDHFASRYSDGPSLLAWCINPANGHPGQTSAHFYATEVADIFERDYPGILGPRSSPPNVLRPRLNDWLPDEIDPREVSPGRWRISWPATDADLLCMPLNQTHLSLCFEVPVAIRTISLQGAGRLSAEMHVSSVGRAQGFDDGHFHALGRKKGNALAWSIAHEDFASSVNTLRIALDRPDSPGLALSRELILEIQFDDPAVRP